MTDDVLYCPRCGKGGMKPRKTLTNGRRRYRCGACRYDGVKFLHSEPQLLPKTKVGEVKKHKRFLVTSSLNDTELVGPAFQTFKRLCDELDARLLIIPTAYRNPDAYNHDTLETMSWPSEIIPFVCNKDVKLSKHLVIRAETRITHTSINPLQGMNHAGDNASEIYGHAQVAMESIATAKDAPAKMIFTTGTVSQPNYGGSKTAKKAQFHHSLSGLFIELEGSAFYPTQVHFDGEGAYLFDRYYTPRSSRKAEAAAAVIHGDSHVRFLEPKVDQLLDHVCDKLKSEIQVYHDVHDHHIGSHHSSKDTLFLLSKSIAGEVSIRDELMLTVNFLDSKSNPVVVDSNHHRHLEQWFNRYTPNGGDVVNARLYYELAEMACAAIEEGRPVNLLKMFVDKYSKREVKFYTGNESLMIKGIDCSQHGDRGPNGSRGSAKSFSRSGHKTFIGHSHTPRIEKGCYQVGTSTLDLPYAVGYSSWCLTSGIIYPNGKRALFNIINKKVSPLLR